MLVASVIVQSVAYCRGTLGRPEGAVCAALYLAGFLFG